MVKGTKIFHWGLALTLGVVPSGTAAAVQDVPSAISGDWSYGMDEGTPGASTVNTAGERFGIVCTDYCIGFIEQDRPCAEGARYNAVRRTALGETQIEMICYPLEGRYILTLLPDAELINSTVAGPEISFVVPIGGGAPATISFSLNGAYDAIHQMLLIAVATYDEGDEI